MDVPFLFKGLLTGMVIAAPVGPTTVLVIQRTIRQSTKDGALSGAGAAMADALYGLLAGFSAGLVLGYIEPHFILVRLIGGAFLIYWGYRIFVSKFAESHPLVKDKGFGGPFVSTFILTLTNPMTLLAFGAILAALQYSGMHYHPKIFLQWAFGIFFGSLSWWLILSGAVHVWKSRFDVNILAKINRVIGVIVVIAGCGVFLDLIKLLASR